MNLSKRLRKLFITLFLVAVGVYGGNAVAATYYVSPTGSSSWPSCTSQSSPCLAGSTTTGKAFLAAGAGDTVYFLDGTYNPGNAPSYSVPAWNPATNGGTFKAVNVGGATIVHNTVGPAIGSNGRTSITWDGFNITKVGGGGGYITAFFNANNSTIQNCDLTGIATTQTGNVTCIFAQDTSGLKVKNNKLHGNTGSSQNYTGITLYSITSSTIENNDVYGNVTGIFDKDGGANNVFRYNFIHNNATSGFLLGKESGGQNPYNEQIYQNVIINHSNALEIQLSNGSASYIYLYNNTIYNASNGINGWGSYNVDHLEICNNIFSGSGVQIRFLSGYTNVYTDYNDLYNITTSGQINFTTYSTISNWRTALGGCPGTGRECNSITTNPSFANAGGSTAADYKRISYPTNGVGGAYPTIMGAYITGNELIGSGNKDVPSPPERFRIVN